MLLLMLKVNFHLLSYKHGRIYGGSNLERTYTGDFELYDERFENKDAPELAISIAIK